VATSKLKAVAPKAAEPSRPKILIYGKPGAGKTWAAIDFPSVYYIDTEGGANLSHYTDKLAAAGGMYMGPEQGANSLDVIIDQIKALTTEKHEFRTLVIDSITKAFDTEIANEAERLGDKAVYGAEKKSAVSKMRQIVAKLDKLDMNVILVAQAKDEYGIDSKGNREVIGETFACWDRLEYELHVCLNVVRQTATSRKAKIRKSRLKEFPEMETMPWSYEEFAKRFGRDRLEKPAEAVAMATEEQVKEVKRLVEVVKLPDGQETKWFTAAGVDGYDEMSAEVIGKVIEHLRGKIAA